MGSARLQLQLRGTNYGCAARRLWDRQIWCKTRKIVQGIRVERKSPGGKGEKRVVSNLRN